MYIFKITKVIPQSNQVNDMCLGKWVHINY